MAICVSSLEDRICSTAARVFKRTSEVRAVIPRTCEPALFVSSLARCYPQFIFLAAFEADTRTIVSLSKHGAKNWDGQSTAPRNFRVDDASLGFRRCCKNAKRVNFALASAKGT
jgi:hypothetical protein